MRRYGLDIWFQINERPRDPVMLKAVSYSEDTDWRFSIHA